MTVSSSYQQICTLHVGGSEPNKDGYLGFFKPFWSLEDKSFGHVVCKKLNDAIKQPGLDPSVSTIISNIFSHIDEAGSIIPIYVEWLNTRCKVYAGFAEGQNVVPVGSISSPQKEFLNVQGGVSSLASSGIDYKIKARGFIESKLSVLSIANRMIVGRGESPEIFSQCKGVSRTHAEIKRVSFNQYHVRDLQSLNGTFIREDSLGSNKYVKLKPGKVVNAGDFVRIGPVESGVVFKLPLSQPIGCVSRSRIVSALCDLRPGSSLRIVGANNSEDTDIKANVVSPVTKGSGATFELKVRELKGLGSFALLIHRDAIWSFRVEIPREYIGNGAVLNFSRDGKNWSVADYDTPLWAGYILRFGVHERIIDVVLPVQLTTKLRTLCAGSKVLVGRSNQELYLDQYPSLSREHAVIYLLDDGSYFVEDLGSMNGSFVFEPHRNPSRLTELKRVNPGSIVRFGGSEHGLWLTLPTYYDK